MVARTFCTLHLDYSPTQCRHGYPILLIRILKFKEVKSLTQHVDGGRNWVLTFYLDLIDFKSCSVVFTKKITII